MTGNIIQGAELTSGSRLYMKLTLRHSYENNILYLFFDMKK